MAIKEKTVVANIFMELRKNFAGFYFKTHGGVFQKVGLPDILGCHKGRLIGIEVKSPGKEKTLTRIQKKVIREINQAGGVAFMATSPEQVRERLTAELAKPVKVKQRRATIVLSSRRKTHPEPVTPKSKPRYK